MVYIPRLQQGIANLFGLSHPEMVGGTLPPIILQAVQAETAIDIAAISDGTSHTVAFSEWVRGDGLGSRGCGLGSAECEGRSRADLFLQPVVFHFPVRRSVQHGLPVPANLRHAGLRGRPVVHRERGMVSRR